MSQPAGRSIPLSLPRRFICDLMHFAQKVPSVPVQRRMRLGPVVIARHLSQPRPSWVALFTKAYALTCLSRPELRRAYLTFPTAHLYEHPTPVASIAVERQVGEEAGVFFGLIPDPQTKSLPELDAQLRRFKEAPVESIGGFRRVLRTSRLPRPIRRLIWWAGLNLWGRKRAHFFGTFGVSVYAGLGAASLHPLSPATTTLNYGTIDERGEVDVRIIYDHRVMDGATVARALDELEQTLLGTVLQELRYLQNAAA